MHIYNEAYLPVLAEKHPAALGQPLLELRGHDVSVALSGAEALERLRSERADLVLCDLGLPGMSGYDVARAVRADAALRSILLVALTGYGQPEDRRRSAEAGFDLHLVKPVALQALDGVLERVPAQPTLRERSGMQS